MSARGIAIDMVSGSKPSDESLLPHVPDGCRLLGPRDVLCEGDRYLKRRYDGDEQWLPLPMSRVGGIPIYGGFYIRKVEQ